MGNGHPRPRFKSALHGSDIPSPLPIYHQLPNRYLLLTDPPSPSRALPFGTLLKSNLGSRLILFIFNSIEAPEVTFTTLSQPLRTIPIHPHIYSNGIICLDLLGTQGWSPVQNVESVCMSLQSMLTGNTKNERPPGDQEFVRRNTQRPRDIRFVYEDSSV